MNKKGIIYGINGPVIYLKGNTGLRMSEMVHVGEEHLVGEVISLSKKATTVQVFEETTGLKPGAEVVGTGDAISVTLGPGILNNIFDGIERPLSEIAARSGKYITRGVSVDSLDTSKKWNVHVTVSEGDHVTGGTVIAETQETASILHRSMVPPDVEGTVIKAAPDGAYTIVDPIVTLELADGTTKELSLCQKWPIRVPRPTKRRFPASKPLITGQRILDTMFPIAKGGTAAVPGWFRYRKNHDAAPDRQVVRCGYHHLYWLRRAWERDDTGTRRVRGTGGSENRASPDESYGPDREYLQHAGGCP